MVRPELCCRGCNAPCFLRHHNINNDHYHYYLKTRHIFYYFSNHICHCNYNQTYRHNYQYFRKLVG